MQPRSVLSTTPGRGHMAMKRILRIFVAVAAVAAIAPAGLAVPVHALTPSQSAAVAAKARADALARAKAQATAKARADAVAKARADATAKSKALVMARHNVQSETRRRTEAAEKAAQAQMQIRTANVQPQLKSAGTQRVAQTKAQTLSKLPVRQVQPLRDAAHPQYAQTVKPHPSTNRPSAQTSRSSTGRSSAHAR
jgi:colicin import membrane protein